MRRFYFLLICLIFSIGMTAQENLSKEEKERRERNIQAANPFKQFGYKGKVATLSKGKYLEVHDLDSIVTIGSVRFHVDRKEIVGVVEVDTLLGDYSRPIGDLPSRWLSPDPLAEEYPDWTPYRFGFNNPIRFSDPTGLLEDDYVFDENGKYVRTDKTETPDMLVIENSKTKDKNYYTFNDPKTDVAAIKYNIDKFGEEGFKEHQFVFGVDDSWMNFFRSESDIEPKGYISRRVFAAWESVGGKMDPSVYSLSVLMYSAGEYNYYDGASEILKDKGPLYIFQGDGYRTYNHLDAGNFLWGNFMQGIGFNTAEAINYAKSYNRNDTTADINAIMRGSTLGNTQGIYGSLPIRNITVNAIKK